MRGQDTLIELPFAALRTIRLVFSLSYVKLLDLSVYRALMTGFPLPDTVILDSHPYDYYVPSIGDNLIGWKKYAHLRGGEQAFELFEQIIRLLRDHGYEFMCMSELCSHVESLPSVEMIPVDGSG